VVREAYAFGCHAIKIRRLVRFAAVTNNITVTEIIGQDNYKVRLAPLSPHPWAGKSCGSCGLQE